ncbi:hypothetical protein BK004_03795 [bacterium CG10_46_32]|nr:MAG: hypothetical protein BK004_03795 [bacterium CG10_46_32]
MLSASQQNDARLLSASQRNEKQLSASQRNEKQRNARSAKTKIKNPPTKIVGGFFICMRHPEFISRSDSKTKLALNLIYGFKTASK